MTALPDPSAWNSLPVRRARDLQRGTVKGRAYAHNPNGHDALALLSRRADAILSAADGRTLAEVSSELGMADLPSADLPTLWRNGFLHTPGVKPAAPPKPERVFNAWLHLTNACNLACPYCYIHKSKRHMSGHVVEQVLAALEATAADDKVDRIHVRYAGGEPMLRFAAMQAFHAQATEVCAKHGVKFSAAVLTNGAVVPKGALQWLKDQRVSVSVSIDGVGAVQDRMRPSVSGGESSALVQAGLDAYQGAGIDPYMLVTVGDSNLDGLPELTEFLLQRKLWFRYSLVRDLQWGAGILDDRHGADGRGQEPSEALLEGPELQRLQGVLGQCYAAIERHVETENTVALRAGRMPAVGFRRGHRFCDLQPWAPIGKACGAGKSYLAIGDDGQVSPCQAALHRAGTQPIRPQSLLLQARGQTQLPEFERDRGNAVCARCPHRASCAGGCPLLLHRREGHVNGRSPYCHVFKAVLPRIVHIAALELWGQAEFARQNAA